jgi:hypothetical protein
LHTEGAHNPAPTGSDSTVYKVLDKFRPEIVALRNQSSSAAATSNRHDSDSEDEARKETNAGFRNKTSGTSKQDTETGKWVSNKRVHNLFFVFLASLTVLAKNGNSKGKSKSTDDGHRERNVGKVVFLPTGFEQVRISVFMA